MYHCRIGIRLFPPQKKPWQEIGGVLWMSLTKNWQPIEVMSVMTDHKPHSHHGHKRRREGYDPHRDNAHRAKGAPKKKHYGAFPSPDVLEAYEALSEGAATQLIAMAEEEQLHRHEWEAAYLRSYTKSHRIGMLFGFITTVLLIIAALWLALSGNGAASAALSISGFSALVVNNILVFNMRRHEKRFVPPPSTS